MVDTGSSSANLSKGTTSHYAFDDEMEDKANDSSYVLDGTSHTEYMSLNWAPILSTIFGNIVLICLALLIGRKCVALELTRTAEHVFYCTTGQLLCVGEALMVEIASLHAALGLLGAGLGIFGVFVQCVIIEQQTGEKRKHVRSSHSIFGLLASLLLLPTVITGIMLLSRQELLATRIPMVLAHRVSGLCCFILLMASLYYSFNTGFMYRNWARQRIIALKSWTVIAAIAISIFELIYDVESIFRLLPDGFFSVQLILKPPVD